MMRRRTFLLGAGGSGLLAAGAGAAWFAAGYRLASGDAAIGLSVKELAVVRAIVETLLPDVPGMPSGLALGVHQRIDQEIWAAAPGLARDLRHALHLLEHLPPASGFPARFSSLSVAERAACFQGWLVGDSTPVVQAAQGLKQLCHLFGYARPEAWQAIGYDGPWVTEERPPASAVRYAELLRIARGDPA